MKKTAFLLLCLCLATLSAFADWDKVYVNFNDTQTSETIKRSGYNVIVNKERDNNDGTATLSIDIKNSNKTQSLYLFDKPLSKSELRKEYKIIVKDDGCKQMLMTNYCEFISDSYCIAPLQMANLGQVKIDVGRESKVVLPVYVAKKKGWLFKKMLIYDWDLLEIIINIEEKNDPDFLTIEQRCNTIIDIISQQQFCKHKKHKQSLMEQEAPFRDEVNELQQLISAKLEKLPRHSKYYSQYERLRKRLDNIEFVEVDDKCGHDKATTSGGTGGKTTKPSKYDNMSLEDICSAIELLYQNLENENTKYETAYKEVNTILNSCKNQHAAAWRRKTDAKDCIEHYYYEIKNFNSKNKKKK